MLVRAGVLRQPTLGAAARAQAKARRVPDLNPRGRHGQDELFTTWRFHAFFTAFITTRGGATDLGTVAADRLHRHHGTIEQVHPDLNGPAPARLPSKSFAANAAWFNLAVLAVNLTRATHPRDAGPGTKLGRRYPPPPSDPR